MLRGELSWLVGGNTGSGGPINTISASMLAEGQVAAAVRRCAPCRRIQQGGRAPFSRERYKSECRPEIDGGRG
jgi:hypothetical protein